MDSSQYSENHPEILRQLHQLYTKKILEVEQRYLFDSFYGPALRKSDFEAKPMVMLLGQYSVGKTTFVEHILKRPYIGARIGPEPTTDRFVAVMQGPEDQTIPGNAVAVDPEKPFHALNNFGNGFLSRFEASIVNSPILERITFIDTPGILSGEKQRLGRSYDFIKVCEWFAHRSDLILLIFDAHKLDISDEFKSAIEALKGNEDKVRCILNKADSVGGQQLMRIYGALMWSLGKVMKTPEALRVYIGSFWDKPYENDDNARLFEAEQRDLVEDLLSLPRNSAVRKINELVKRARDVRAHAALLSHLYKKMPLFFGKESTQKDLIQNLANEFREIEREQKIPISDFAEIPRLQEVLKSLDFSNFPKYSERLMNQMEVVLQQDLPQIMKLVAPAKVEVTNPFLEERWVIDDSSLQHYHEIFASLNPASGLITGNVAHQYFSATGLSLDALRKIWDLVDFEKTGQLDFEEFALAVWLTERAKVGEPVPDKLTMQMIPVAKRKQFGKKN